MSRGLGIVALTVATAAGIALGGYASSTDPSEPNHSLTPWSDGCSSDEDCVAMDRALTDMGRTLDPVTTDPAAILSVVLPYWRVDPPEWCAEDMACWIGSTADGRSPQQILDDLPADLISSSGNYASDDEVTVEPGWEPISAELS